MRREELIPFFHEELFIPKLKAKTKDQVLVEMVEKFVEAKFIRDRNVVLELLRRRESLGSTGIGKGVAIPHGRTTVAPDVMIAFGRSEKGIDFDAIDAKPVYLVFLVLAPPQEENNRYLPTLGKLVELVADRKVRTKLAKVEDFQGLVVLFREPEEE